MTTKDKVLAQVSDLLECLNKPKAKGNNIAGFFKHPFILTVVGSLLITAGSNEVTKRFQIRDKQSDAVATLESEIPMELSITTYLAMILSVLESEGCSSKPDKKLESAFVIGLTGKSCKDAEAEYQKYYMLTLEHPTGSSLVRVRALFLSPVVDEGAVKLSTLIKLLSFTPDNKCIDHVSEQARGIYGELVDFAIQEIDGKEVRDTPNIFNLTDLISYCPARDLCRVPSITKDTTIKVHCPA